MVNQNNENTYCTLFYSKCFPPPPYFLFILLQLSNIEPQVEESDWLRLYFQTSAYSLNIVSFLVRRHYQVMFCKDDKGRKQKAGDVSWWHSVFWTQTAPSEHCLEMTNLSDPYTTWKYICHNLHQLITNTRRQEMKKTSTKKRFGSTLRELPFNASEATKKSTSGNSRID